MEATTSQSSAEITWGQAALWLAAPLLVLLAVIVVRLAVESRHRPDLEQTVELTAVGDLHYYQPPVPDPATPQAATTYQGQPLIPISYRRLDLRDSSLTRLGTDDAGKLRIYTTHDSLPPRNGEPERRNEPVYLIKTGPEEYLKTQPAVK